MPWKILPLETEDTVNDMQILPSITTITDSWWLDKIAEVKELKLKEVALFLTCLDKEERARLYRLLEATSVERIPLVHLKSGMELGELDYLVENYQTKAFNTHTKREHPHLKDYGKYKEIIYIENTYEPLDEEEIKEFGGICLDFSHLENDRLFRPDIYRHTVEIAEKYPCGCNHIATAKTFPILDRNFTEFGSKHPHLLKSLSELDYLKRYPLRYFAPLVALEFENTIKEQLAAKEYLKTLLQK